MSSLPPIGLEIPCSSYAVNVPLKVEGLGVLTMDFKGGWKVRVEANINGGLGGVKLKIIGNEWSGDSPKLGKVTISQADTDQTPLSLLEITSDNPRTLRDTMFLDFTMTIERPPGGGPPLRLSNVKSARMLNEKLTVYPPQGSMYQLQEPVDFAPAGEPSKVVATLLQYPLTVSHNP